MVMANWMKEAGEKYWNGIPMPKPAVLIFYNTVFFPNFAKNHALNKFYPYAKMNFDDPMDDTDRDPMFNEPMYPMCNEAQDQEYFDKGKQSEYDTRLLYYDGLAIYG